MDIPKSSSFGLTLRLVARVSIREEARRSKRFTFPAPRNDGRGNRGATMMDALQYGRGFLDGFNCDIAHYFEKKTYHL